MQFKELGHGFNLQNMILFRPKLPNRKNHLLSQFLDTVLLKVSNSARRKDNLYPFPPCCSLPQRLNVIVCPRGIDKRQTRETSHYSIQDCKGAVVRQFGIGRNATAGNILLVIVRTSSAFPHEVQHVCANRWIVHVGQYFATKDDARHDICERTTRGIDKDVRHGRL